MKALSVKQPWAHLIVHGIESMQKSIETRTWYTEFRGDLLIVSSKKPLPGDWGPGWEDIEVEYGKAIGVANMVDCRRMTIEDELAAMCDCYAGAFSWVFENIRPITPFPVRGQLGLYNVDYEYEEVA